MEKRVISPEKLEEFYHNPAVWKKVKEYMKVTGGGIPSWHLPDMSEEEFVELLEPVSYTHLTLPTN